MIVNNAALSIRVRVFERTYILSSVGYVPRSRIIGSNGVLLFKASFY